MAGRQNGKPAEQCEDVKPGLVLVGGGGHCVSCIDVIEAEDRFQIAGIADTADRMGQTVLGYPICVTDDELAGMVDRYGHFLITLGQIGSPSKRVEKFEYLRAMNARFPVIVSPRSHVSRHATVGDGTIVMHGAIVNAGAVIGRNCIINTGAIIEHDVVIGDHCHISTGATVNGGCTVGEWSFVGSNSVTKEGIVLQKKSFIKANSTVGASNE